MLNKKEKKPDRPFSGGPGQFYLSRDNCKPPGRFCPLPGSFDPPRAAGTGQNFPGNGFFSRERNFFFRDAKNFTGKGFLDPGTQIF